MRNNVRKRSVVSALATGLIVLTAALPASAYYDEVHYALTYYIAREMGFTPWQALRIASGCVSVDYAPDTEPVQMKDILNNLGIKTVAEAKTKLLKRDAPMDDFSRDPGILAAAEAQWKFHAFRDLGRFPSSGGKPHPQADNAIVDQEHVLWSEAIQMKNPGIYLHFFQDEEPHAYYTSIGGHWFLPEGVSLPMGSTTDWLSYRKASNLKLARDTERNLIQFLNLVSNGKPKQRLRPLDAAQVEKVLAAMRAVNAFPPPLESYTQTIKIKALGLLGTKADFDNTRLTENEQKHLDGPDLDEAVKAINKIFEQEGPSEGRMPARPINYAILNNGPDSHGAYFKDPDSTVVVGDLQLWVEAKSNLPPTSIEAHILWVPTLKAEQEYELDSQTDNNPSTDRVSGNMPFLFRDMPIGQVKVQINFKYPDGSTRCLIGNIMLKKAVNRVTIAKEANPDWTPRTFPLPKGR